MHSWTANRDSRLLFWQRVREFAVPPPMIETATARRAVGDWAGACAAARVDVDLNLPTVSRTYGREFAATIRADLRHLAPDLLRWHMPRIAPDGLLRPGLTVSLARYRPAGPDRSGTVHLVARTPPAWADAGQRISLALWDADEPGRAGRGHPHPRPDRRFRLDLHRHLWDARRVGELRRTSLESTDGHGCRGRRPRRGPVGRRGRDTARRRGAARRQRRRTPRDGPASCVLNDGLGRGRRGLLARSCRTRPPGCCPIWNCSRAGLIDADRLHPLIAPVLVPGYRPSGEPRGTDERDGPRLVECRGEQHRIGVVQGTLVALDHDPDQLRREELLAALGGTPLPCLRAIDEAHRHPESLVDVRARLDHGDAAGALAAVESLLGPDVLLRSGALRDELETARSGGSTYGLFRAGLIESGPPPLAQDRRRRHGYRTHPRHASSR